MAGIGTVIQFTSLYPQPVMKFLQGIW